MLDQSDLDILLDVGTELATPAEPAPTPAQLADWESGAAADPRKRKDWAPLRALAQKRARVTLVKIWEDQALGRRIYHARYRRFCYKDCQRGRFTILEGPQTLSFAYSSGSKGEGNKPTEIWRYILSFKRGKARLYRRLGPKKVTHGLPLGIKVMAPVIEGKTAYPTAHARFSRRLVKLCRAKARANGVKLAKGSYLDFQTFLFDSLYPGLIALRPAYEAANGKELALGQEHRWMLRHLRAGSSTSEVVRSMTGRRSGVVTAFWDALKTKDGLGKWCWCALLRSWLPADQMCALLAAESVTTWNPASFTTNAPKVRRFLKQLRPREVVHALTQTCTNPVVLTKAMGIMEAAAPDRQWGKHIDAATRTRAFGLVVRSVKGLPNLTLSGRSLDDLLTIGA